MQADRAATQQRFLRLKEYCEDRAEIDPRHFHCQFAETSCQPSLGPGLKLKPGGLAHVGEEYDLTFDSRELRILFVGYDYGNSADWLESRRDDIQSYGGSLNPHYKGIVKVLLEIFQVRCQSEEDVGAWKPLLRRMSQTNATRCCAPRDGRMRTNMPAITHTNCWTHFKAEIQILEPTIMFFHGAGLRKSFLQCLSHETHPPMVSPLFPELGQHCHVVEWRYFTLPFKTILLFYNHPAYGHFGRQWESHVLPVLQALREMSLIPSLASSWKPRQRIDWPSI